MDRKPTGGVGGRPEGSDAGPTGGMAAPGPAGPPDAPPPTGVPGLNLPGGVAVSETIVVADASVAAAGGSVGLAAAAGLVVAAGTAGTSIGAADAGAPLAGGTGVALPWMELGESLDAMASGHRIVLAGGLTAENVGEAIDYVSPMVVDVSSGVESSPGIKDQKLVRAFIAAARASGAAE